MEQKCTKRSRHIKIRYFCMKDLVDKNQDEIDFCVTENVLVDFFTKPVREDLFKKFRSVALGHSQLSALCKHESQCKLNEYVGRNNVWETDNEQFAPDASENRVT